MLKQTAFNFDPEPPQAAPKPQKEKPLTLKQMLAIANTCERCNCELGKGTCRMCRTIEETDTFRGING
jgi:hypothetical protein